MAHSTEPAPTLAELLRWLQEMPAAFLTEPAGFPGGRTPVAAVVADLAESATGQLPGARALAAFAPRDAGRGERNRLRWVLAGCHLLWHPDLRRGATEQQVLAFLDRELAALAGVVPVEQLHADEERREELIRLALRALGRRLPGESASDTEDRLTQVSSVERHRLLRDAAAREKRARDIRRRMAEEAAREAAARYSPE